MKRTLLSFMLASTIYSSSLCFAEENDSQGNDLVTLGFDDFLRPVNLEPSSIRLINYDWTCRAINCDIELGVKVSTCAQSKDLKLVIVGPIENVLVVYNPLDCAEASASSVYEVKVQASVANKLTINNYKWSLKYDLKNKAVSFNRE